VSALEKQLVEIPFQSQAHPLRYIANGVEKTVRQEKEKFKEKRRIKR
jgi:hypothetical protein